MNHRFYDDMYINKKEFYDLNTHLSLLRQGFKYIIDFKGTCIPRSQISKTANILFNLWLLCVCFLNNIFKYCSDVTHLTSLYEDYVV